MARQAKLVYDVFICPAAAASTRAAASWSSSWNPDPGAAETVVAAAEPLVPGAAAVARLGTVVAEVAGIHAPSPAPSRT